MIIGGGIGGLATAAALLRRGIDADVYESADALRAVGAGIWVPSNAMQVLDRLGLARAVREAGQPVDRAELRDWRGGVLQSMDFRRSARTYGFGTIAIHRAALQDVLAGAVPRDRLHLGRHARGLELRTADVEVVFADGGRVDAPVLVGADGVRSATRAAIAPDAELRYSGQTSYRGVARFELPAALRRVTREVWGPGRRFGFSALGDGRVYWFAALDSPAGETETPAESARRVAALAAGFPPPIPELVAATRPDGLTRTDMYDLRPMRSWHRGRAVLLGDAAHATTPNLGQGGAQAIEDAWVLADCLATHEPSEAFRAYEERRMKEATRVVKRSRQIGRLAHLRHPVARAARNLLLRLTPGFVTRREMDALYRLDD